MINQSFGKGLSETIFYGLTHTSNTLANSSRTLDGSGIAAGVLKAETSSALRATFQTAADSISIPPLVAMPFRYFWFVVFLLQNTAILFIPLGLISGLTTSPSEDPAYRDKIGGFLWFIFFLAMTIFVFAYSIDLFSEDDFIYNVFVSDYLQLYPFAFSTVFLGASFALVILRNIFVTSTFDFEESARNRENLRKEKEKQKQDDEESLNEDTV